MGETPKARAYRLTHTRCTNVMQHERYGPFHSECETCLEAEFQQCEEAARREMKERCLTVKQPRRYVTMGRTPAEEHRREGRIEGWEDFQKALRALPDEGGERGEGEDG